MVTWKSSCLLLTLFISFFNLTVQRDSSSFPLTFARVLSKKSAAYKTNTISTDADDQQKHPKSNYRSNYSVVLIASIPIGNPPQMQQMVLDTGSQLSWIKCDKTSRSNMSSFRPSLSSSFNATLCNRPSECISDSTLGTTCFEHRCKYSYFYADGTVAEGSFFTENFTISTSNRSLVLGCANKADSSGADGILGMNLGELSFISQADVSKFSYCAPHNADKSNQTNGAFYLGDNPNYGELQYVDLSIFPRTPSLPNLDPLAYTVPLSSISIRGEILNISEKVFLPDAGGSGQTILDSGSQYTHLVDEAYREMRRTVENLTRSRLIEDESDMCFNGTPSEIGVMIGDLVFSFSNDVKITISGENTIDFDVARRGVSCFGIKPLGTMDGGGRNIIGNFHQRNMWVEYDVINKRVGFVKADGCKTV